VSGESIVTSSPPSSRERGSRVRVIANSFFSLRARVEEFLPGTPANSPSGLN
jgi:hypothetical protein